MKKLSILLVALTILPFSTSRCLTDNQATFIGCATIVSIILGGYCYSKHLQHQRKTPDNTANNPKEKSVLDIAQKNPDKDLISIVQKHFPQAPTTEKNTEPEIITQKISPIIKQTEERKTAQSASGKIINPTIVAETPTTNIEPVTKAESGFLTNVRNSIEKMNLERLLLENIDVLEG